MSKLIRFDPLRDLRRSFWGGWPVLDELAEDWEHTLSIDMYETEKEVIVETDLPGVTPEDVDIQVTADTVTIQGEKKEEVEEKKKDWMRRERSYGRYSRTLGLPVPVIADQAEAEFKDGTLRLVIPKEKKATPKKVTVKAKASK